MLLETLGLCKDCQLKLARYLAKQRVRQTQVKQSIGRRGQQSFETELRADLPARARRVLEDWPLHQILMTSDSDYRHRVRGIGQKTYEQMLVVLDRYGLEVGMSQNELELLWIDVPSE